MKPNLEDILVQARSRQIDGDHRRAVELCHRVLALRPVPKQASEALVVAGTSLEALQSDSEAYEAYRRASKLDPSSFDAFLALAKILLAHGNIDPATSAFRSAIALSPNDAMSRICLAQALLASNRETEAQEQLEYALSLDPNLSEAHAMLGYRLQTLGRFDEARAHFEQSIALNPNQAVSYFGISQGRRISANDRPLLERMQAVLENPHLADPDRMNILYALGKARSDLGEFGSAMTAWDSANEIARQVCLGGRPFARERYQVEIDRTLSTFTPDFLRAQRRTESDSRQPIFIVGMLRSGTTLMDQILSSHPDVGAMGERPFWLTQPLTQERAPAIQQAFLQMQVDAAGLMPFITDKTPQNFQVLGWIHLMFPQARIIHMSRHPVDNCLSIYSTAFDQSPEFAHDKSNIVFAYQKYRQLMDHWHAVLPCDRLIHVKYEDLVRDHEETVQRVVEFCGLDWDPACLSHTTNPSAVKTPSMWQVRQPIYKDSMEKWRQYEPWLGELSALL